MNSENHIQNISVKTAYISSIALAVITLLTFSMAIIAVPISGSACPANCIEYPYLNSLQQYPHDYYWMFLAMAQLVIFCIYIISLHYISSPERKVISSFSVAFSLLAVLLLMADYYIQFAVIPVSLSKGQTEGIALLTQYNPNGIFIAIEELGYWLMSLSLLAIAFIFRRNNKLERTLRWTLALPLVLNIVTFILISFRFGINREYRFEIATISYNWLSLVVSGVLSAIYFRKKLKDSHN